MPIEDFCIDNDAGQRLFVAEGDDVAEFLGITKYEPAIPEQLRGVQGKLFGYTKSYDVESIQNYPNTFVEGDEVVVTEKLHGTQASFGFLQHPPEDAGEGSLIEVNGKKCAYTSSKGLSKSGIVQKYTPENQDNVWIKAYNKFIKPIAPKLVEDQLGYAGLQRIIIYGEIFGPGVQGGFPYGQKESSFRVFDVWHEFKELDRTIKQSYRDDLFLDAFM